jgi:hypothetical protein
MAPTVDHLLGGTAADSQLQAPAGNQIRSAGILRHIMRILISHVYHGGANLNFPRFSANRRKQWSNVRTKENQFSSC